MSSATAHETGKGQFQVSVQTGGHSFLMDEPVAVGGLDSGPNPFDMLCAAMASCTLMTMKLYANRKGWNLDGLDVGVTHRKGSAGARDRFECALELGNATDEQREALLRIAQRCPVHLLLESGADAPTAIAPTEESSTRFEGPLDNLAA
jgi:putative redox protein